MRRERDPLIGLGRRLWLGRSGTTAGFGHLQREERKCRRPSPWADRGRKDGVSQESKVGNHRMQERNLELPKFSEKSHCFAQ